jgi:hypothetical protein
MAWAFISIRSDPAHASVLAAAAPGFGEMVAMSKWTPIVLAVGVLTVGLVGTLIAVWAWPLFFGPVGGAPPTPPTPRSAAWARSRCSSWRAARAGAPTRTT